MPPKNRPTIVRFMEKVRPAESGCWQWTAYAGKHGYGRFYLNGKGALAHRWSYEYHVGPIPDGLVLDHLCRNTSCVNPEHLEPVTTSENVLRGLTPQITRERALAITHCPQGHEYTAENTYTGGRGRTCLTCKRALARENYEKTRDITIARSREWRLANPERHRELMREGQQRYRDRKRQKAI